MIDLGVTFDMSSAGELTGYTIHAGTKEREKKIKYTVESIMKSYGPDRMAKPGLFFAFSTAGVEEIVCYAKDKKIRERCARDGRKMLWSLIPGSTAWQKGSTDE